MGPPGVTPLTPPASLWHSQIAVTPDGSQTAPEWAGRRWGGRRPGWGWGEGGRAGVVGGGRVLPALLTIPPEHRPWLALPSPG